MLIAVKKVSEFLGSIRLAITLLIILTIISFFGVLIPQELSHELYLRKWGAALGNGLLFLGINHVFSTPWFYVLLGFFSCNILFCSLTRLWRNIRTSLKRSFLAGKGAIEQCRHTTCFTSPRESEAVVKVIERQLHHRRYATKTQTQGAGFQIVAKIGLLKDLGSLVFHLSIIVLLIGGLVGSKYGYSFIKDLRGGQIVNIPDRAFLLRCDWFKLEQNEDGSVKEYTSKLSILSRADSSLILAKIIRVNSPLSYQGIRFYQSSYGQDAHAVASVFVSILGPGLPDSGFSGPVAYDTPVKIPGTNLVVNVSNYLPDFIIDLESNVAATRSNEPNNPAVKIVLLSGKDTLYQHWAFFKFPDQHAQNEHYKVTADSYEPSYYTGIQIRKNPGIPLIWLGIILMTLGIFAVFYIPKKSLWVLIEPAGPGTSLITLGGTSNRAPADFQNEFDKFSTQLNTTLKQDA